MALRTFVKISNISNLSDARYCAGMMVDILGYNIDPSSNTAISSEDYSEIAEWVAGVQFAGEFHNATIHQVKDAIKRYEVDYIEIEKMDLVEQANLLGKSVIFRLYVNNSNINQWKPTLDYLGERVKMVLIKCQDGSLFDELDARIGHYNGNARLLKGYGIDGNGHLHQYPGLELEAKEEERPGFKDYGQVMDLLEAIEE